MNELRVFFCIPKSMYEEIKSVDESTPTLDAIERYMFTLNERLEGFGVDVGRM